MKERGLLAVTLLAFGMAAVACGGPDKPPMTPDSPDMSGIDAGSSGTDVPVTPTPILPSTPSAK